MHGTSTDLGVFDGTVDLTGHASATVGNASDFLLSQARPVPEPAPLVLWPVPLRALRWRCRRASLAS